MRHTDEQIQQALDVARQHQKDWNDELDIYVLADTVEDLLHPNIARDQLPVLYTQEVERAERAENALNNPVRIARLFHENYERLAPAYGYKTRDESAVPWHLVPEPNRDLMIETARAVVAALQDDEGQG